MNRAERRRQKSPKKAANNQKVVQSASPSSKLQQLTIGQALKLAAQHHTAGRLPQAGKIYEQILQSDPHQPIALHFLGLIAHQVGRSNIAVSLISKALAINPEYAEAHNNFGNVLNNLGRPDDAVDSFGKALALKPDYAEAHNNLGIALQALSKLDDAVASFRKAVDIKPDYAEAHNNLGIALRALSKLDDAVASYRKALAIKPDYEEAYNNLGIALHKLGKLDEALASYRKSLAIKPDYAEAHYNQGTTLRELGKLDDAVTSCQKALSIKPDFAEAHNNLGNALKDLGRFSEAKAAFDQGFHINHGGPWWNAATFADGDGADTEPPARAVSTSTFKLRDTIDQVEYLIAKARIDPSFQLMADHYRALLADIQSKEQPDASIKLTPYQVERLGSSHNRVIHYVDAPRIGTGTINESLDFKQIEDSYFSSPVSVTTLDDFLTPEALRGLRDFCLESTIFFSCTGNDFVDSRITSGFNCDLLYQVAEEVKEHFPRVLGGHHLANMWIYRYDNQSRGVAAHTDEGAVTFNFWITPDDANRIPNRGGLIVFAREQPSNWDWRYYNSNKYTPAIGREIADFLADADTVTIPYRENRAVLFHSNLFHKSDQIHFRDGFENRRMNVTLLYGKREI